MHFKKPSATTKAKLLAGIHAVVLLIVLVHRHDHDSAKAAEPKCRNVGASSSRATLGSQVDGDLVTICLDAKFRKKLLQAIKPKAPAKVSHPVAKRPTLKPKPPVKPKPVAKPAAKPTVKTAPKPRPVVHKNPPKASPRSTQNIRGDRAVFRPTTSGISVSPAANLKPKQRAGFSTVPKVSFGNSKLLGRPVAVRFKPLDLSWNFGDGVTSESNTSDPEVSHSYAAEGIYWVNLQTRFRVEYRLASGKWLADPDSITLSSKPRRVQVGQSFKGGAPKIVLLTTH